MFYLYVSKGQMKDVSWAAKATSRKVPSPSPKASWVIKDKVFKIKIADLLNETWRQDQIEFDHKFSDQLPHLDEHGISWSFTIQSLDNTSLLGTLSDVEATFHESCDSCWASFLRHVHVPSYSTRFVFEDVFKKQEEEDSEEVVFFIDPKAETIDIGDMVVQAILLNDPFVKRCESCSKRLASLSDDDDDLDDFSPGGNITFS